MGWGENDRGVSFTFGAEVRLFKFTFLLVKLNLTLLVKLALILLVKLTLISFSPENFDNLISFVGGGQVPSQTRL